MSIDLPLEIILIIAGLVFILLGWRGGVLEIPPFPAIPLDKPIFKIIVIIVGAICLSVSGLMLFQKITSLPETTVKAATTTTTPSPAETAIATATIAIITPSNEPGNFSYRVHVQSMDGQKDINNARVILVTETDTEYKSFSDNDGFVIFSIINTHQDKRARLIVKADGYAQYEEIITMSEGFPHKAQLQQLTAASPALPTLSIPSPTNAAAPIVSTPVPFIQKSEHSYRVRETFDGFVVLRAQPTTNSSEMARLAPDTIITCDGVVRGQLLDNSDEWVFCSSLGGYIFASLLEKQTTSETSISSSANPTDLTVCNTATVVGVDALAIRDQPSLSSHRIGSASRGQSVDVLCDEPVQADERIWLRVRIGSIIGWMSSRFLQTNN